jgi:hypothetical protein
MINRLNFRYLAVLLFLIDFVRCGCKNNHPFEDNNSTSNPSATDIGSNLPPATPITQAMIDTITIAPGLQALLQQLQAGGNVDVNQPIDSKRNPALVFPANDLPLNLICAVLIQYGAAEVAYTQDRLKIIESLLSRGAKPNPTITLGMTSRPLLFSVITNKRLDILKLLLKYKDPTFTQPYKGRTAYAYTKVALTPAEQPPFIQAFEAVGINS